MLFSDGPCSVLKKCRWITCFISWRHQGVVKLSDLTARPRPPAVRSPPLHDGHPGVGQVEGSLIPVLGFTCFVKGLKLKLAVFLRKRNLVYCWSRPPKLRNFTKMWNYPPLLIEAATVYKEKDKRSLQCFVTVGLHSRLEPFASSRLPYKMRDDDFSVYLNSAPKRRKAFSVILAFAVIRYCCSHAVSSFLVISRLNPGQSSRRFLLKDTGGSYRALTGSIRFRLRLFRADEQHFRLGISAGG